MYSWYSNTPVNARLAERPRSCSAERPLFRLTPQPGLAFLHFRAFFPIEDGLYMMLVSCRPRNIQIKLFPWRKKGKKKPLILGKFFRLSYFGSINFQVYWSKAKWIGKIWLKYMFFMIVLSRNQLTDVPYKCMGNRVSLKALIIAYSHWHWNQLRALTGASLYWITAACKSPRHQTGFEKKCLPRYGP